LGWVGVGFRVRFWVRVGLGLGLCCEVGWLVGWGCVLVKVVFKFDVTGDPI
jgi:hypothetical protein